MIIKKMLETITNKLNLNTNSVQDAYKSTLPHLQNVRTKEDAQNVLKNLGINQDFLNKMLPLLKNEKSQKIAQSFGINLNGVENQIKSLFSNNTTSNYNTYNNNNNNDELDKLRNNLKKLK